MIVVNKWFVCVFLLTACVSAFALDTSSKPVKFRVVAIAEEGNSPHNEFVAAAKVWLAQLAAENDFAVDYITNTDPINDAFLAKYRLFIQLNYPPYRWTPVAKKAFERYIERGTGGWIGFHHAMLLGDFDGYPMWTWWSHFMGDIRYTSYIAQFATATVKVDDPNHPATKGLPSSFTVDKEEWYTWSRSNRANVHVLASVDESLRPGTFTFLWVTIRSCFKTRISRSSSGTPSSGVRASEELLRAGVVSWDAVFECRRRGRTAKGFDFLFAECRDRPRSLCAGCAAVFRGPCPEGQFRTGSDDQLGRSQRRELEVVSVGGVAQRVPA
jgi:uncharacterized protein